MKILQIVKGLDIGNIHGGAERFAAELAVALKLGGQDVTVCAFFEVGTETEKTWRNWIVEKGVPYLNLVPWTRNNDFRNYWAGISDLKAYLQKRPVDICHSHFQLGTLSAAYMKAIGLSRRVIRTCHVTQEWDPTWYGWLREQILSRWFFPLWLDAEVGVSREITQKIDTYPLKFIKRHKAVYINNAIPMKATAPLAQRNGQNRDKSKKIIGTVGRLTAVKGYRYLIEAAPFIRAAIPEIEIWIIGDGELREELKKLAERVGVTDTVIFFGQREDVAVLIAQMDMLVMSSLREGLPTVVLESFAQGVPVVGTNVSGIRELVYPGETGWLAPPADAQGLAGVIIQALKNDEEQKRFGKNGKAIAAKYSIEKVAEQYLALYERILAG